MYARDTGAPKKHITSDNKKYFRSCADTAGPYLKSGETIVLTTDRVFIDHIEYDLILTSQRLALVDSGHTVDQPQMVPFSTIISVKGGTSPAREPVIALTVIDPEGAGETRTLDMAFSQRNEDRSAECDIWVKKLIEHIVSVRQEPREIESLPAVEKPRGMQPTVRRFIAPDVPLPHTEVARSRTPSEKLLSAMQSTAWESEPEITKKETPGEETSTTTPDSPPVDEIPVTPPAHKEKETAPVPEGEYLDGSDQSGDDIPPELDIAEEPPMQSAVPATPFKELLPDDNAGRPGASLPVPPEVHPAGLSGDIVELSRQIEETEPVRAEDPGAIRPEASGPVGIPDNVVFPVLTGTSPDTTPRTASLPDSPTGKEPEILSSPSQPKTKRVTVTAAAIVVAIVVLVVISAVAVLTFLPVLEQEYGPGLPNQTPAITSLPVTTIPPTGEIPAQGVWIKVTYNGTYYGKYGNPGNLIEVRGSGEQVYAIKGSTNLVEAGFQKLDLSGNNLTVEVYNNGTLITQAFKATPGGEVAILVNSTTGKPPFVPVTTVAM